MFAALARLRMQASIHSMIHPKLSLVVVATALALVSHLVFISFLPMQWQKNESADFRVFYEPVGRQWAMGHGFHLPSGKPALKYPPGIPIVYGATLWFSEKLDLSDQMGLRILQTVLSLATSLLVAAIAIEFLDARVGLLACFLWSTNPFHRWMSKQPSGQMLACVFLLLSVFTFLRWSSRGRASIAWGGTCGMSVAFAALTKPFHIALWAVFVILAWICDVPVTRWKRVLFSLAVMMAFVLTILPWEIWACRKAGHFIPLCSNDAASVVDGLAFGLGGVRSQTLPPLPASVAKVADDFAARRRQLASNRQVLRLLIAHLREEPSAVALLYLVKGIRCWYANASHHHERWTVMIQLSYLPLCVAGGWFAWRSGRLYKNFLLIAIVVTLYYWGMTTMAALAIVRYMLPAISLLMILAGNAVYAVWDAPGCCRAWTKSAPLARPETNAI